MKRYDREKAKDRWTISQMEQYGDFCGWDTIEDLIEAVEIDMKGPAGEILIHDNLEQREARALIATLFETGARIGEVIGQEKEDGVEGLTVDDVKYEGETVEFRIEVEKRYEKVTKKTKYKSIDPDVKRVFESEEEAKDSDLEVQAYEGFETRRKSDTGEIIRRVSVPSVEPLIERVLKWRNFQEKEKEGSKLFDIKYNRFYRTIKKAGEKIGEDFPPHRLRAERATQLLLEYGLDGDELTSWFKWKSPRMAMEYTTLKPQVSEAMMAGAEKKFGTS